MRELKLAKLPDRTPVKITIRVSPDLNATLQVYAELYRETYGDPEPLAELIPYMLENFLKSDLGSAEPAQSGSMMPAKRRPGHVAVGRSTKA
jgi:hypothetical protein